MSVQHIGDDDRGPALQVIPPHAAAAKAVPTEATPHPKTLVVVPTYEEAPNIEFVLTRIRVEAPWVDIAVVDDNSPDGTAVAAERVGREPRPDRRVAPRPEGRARRRVPDRLRLRARALLRGPRRDGRRPVARSGAPAAAAARGRGWRRSRDRVAVHPGGIDAALAGSPAGAVARRERVRGVHARCARARPDVRIPRVPRRAPCVRSPTRRRERPATRSRSSSPRGSRARAEPSSRCRSSSSTGPAGGRR